jgi:ABC-type transport system substrate-binding protein
MRDEARKVTLGMLKDQALSGSGYFGTSIGQTHMPVWKMTAAQRTAPWDIPPADRQQISEALQRAGKPVDENTIQAVYKNAQGVH